MNSVLYTGSSHIDKFPFGSVVVPELYIHPRVTVQSGSPDVSAEKLGKAQIKRTLRMRDWHLFYIVVVHGSIDIAVVVRPYEGHMDNYRVPLRKEELMRDDHRDIRDRFRQRPEITEPELTKACVNFAKH